MNGKEKPGAGDAGFQEGFTSVGHVKPNSPIAEKSKVLTVAAIEAEIEEQKRRSGRECGSCSLCCKILPINRPEFKKPGNKWCKHCRPANGGCGIYHDRPEVCRGFACAWLMNPGLSDEWRPDRAKIVIHGGENVRFAVDPNYPNRWREAPYYQTIKNIARVGLTGRLGFQYKTLVDVGERTWIVLPNKEVKLNGPYVALQVGPDSWEVINFPDEESAKRYLTELEEFDRHIDGLELALELSERGAS